MRTTKRKIETLAEIVGLKAGGIIYDPLQSDMENSDGLAFVSCSNGVYEYGTIEKGKKKLAVRTMSLDDLLYSIFWDLTFGAAVQYELHHRRNNEDFRRQIFEYQLSLLGRLNSGWQLRARSDISNILEKNPYIDLH